MNLKVSQPDILLSYNAKSLSESGDKQRYVEKLKSLNGSVNLDQGG